MARALPRANLRVVLDRIHAEALSAEDVLAVVREQAGLVAQAEVERAMRHRIDRLRALGNAVVPAQAAHAFEQLWRRAMKPNHFCGNCRATTPHTDRGDHLTCDRCGRRLDKAVRT